LLTSKRSTGFILAGSALTGLVSGAVSPLTRRYVAARIESDLYTSSSCSLPKHHALSRTSVELSGSTDHDPPLVGVGDRECLMAAILDTHREDTTEKGC
jgi:hypothetical protein